MKKLYVDIETTGLSITRDRIVEIGLILPSGESKSIRLNPTIQISQEASRVHKIYNEDVVDCKTFKEISKNLFNLIDSVDLIIGYNLDSYDIPLLEVEFLRCGMIMPVKKTLDIYKLWMHIEKDRKLTTCYRRFIGKNLDGAHNASIDINSSRECLEAMMNEYNIELNEAIIRSQIWKKY